jgi:hypothetical protein
MPKKRDNDEERRERVEHQVREIRKRPPEPIEIVPRESDQPTGDGENDYPPRQQAPAERDDPAC